VQKSGDVAAAEAVESGGVPNVEAAPEAFGQLITLAAQRFVRCHFPVPLLDDRHALKVCGAVVEPLLLDLQALRALPAASQTVVTECGGNGRTTLWPKVPGEQWGRGAVSTAQWTGAPLVTLLDKAGLKETAVELVFTGADTFAYQRSLPREAALDPATLVAFEMNGAPVPPQFGGPLRLVVPGWYGMASVKWLARIEAVETPFSGEFQTEKYLYGPGAPVSRIRIKSMFTAVPETLRAGEPVRIGGLAWGGEGVARVDVFAGGVWREARLVGPALPHAWRRFEVSWTPRAAGPTLLRCRATDTRGVAQPELPDWNPGGYGANAIEQRAVTVL
jgi:DMSO/TMAO reductase YedYZ molybdopterin-dependent catalytic subunit